jgi:xanthosine utilization system XapX-like protein
MVTIFVLVLLVSALVVLMVRKRHKRKQREQVIAKLKEESQQVYLIRAKDIIPSLPSRLIDHPENTNLIFAVLGVLFFYIYFVILIGFPPITAVVGLVGALIPSYLRSVWIKILDIKAHYESLEMLNDMSGLLNSPNVTQEWLMERAQELAQSEWVAECFERSAKGQEIRFPNLERVTGVWASIAHAMRAGGERYVQTGRGISSALVIQVSDVTSQVKEIEEVTSVLVALSNAVLPGAIGIGMITILMSLLRGTGKAGPLINNVR